MRDRVVAQLHLPGLHQRRHLVLAVRPAGVGGGDEEGQAHPGVLGEVQVGVDDGGVGAVVDGDRHRIAHGLGQLGDDAVELLGAGQRRGAVLQPQGPVRGRRARRGRGRGRRGLGGRRGRGGGRRRGRRRVVGQRAGAGGGGRGGGQHEQEFAALHGDSPFIEAYGKRGWTKHVTCERVARPPRGGGRARVAARRRSPPGRSTEITSGEPGGDRPGTSIGVDFLSVVN